MWREPLVDDFLEWVKNDQNKLKVQNALRARPSLANIEDWVSFNQLYLLVIIFTS